MATRLYPVITIERNLHPNRWYAIPLLGFFFKVLLVIPVAVELFFLKIALFAFSIINCFSIFIDGVYWKTSYDLALGTMRLGTNVSMYLWGLTDTYPGFDLKSLPEIEFSLSYPKKPNRIFATPFLGVIFRLVLMIPYFIFQHIINLAAFLAIFASWIPVLFTKRYPETTYEIARDSVRIDQAIQAYFLGLSDTYPSFWISMNHKTLKIVLLILAGLLTLFSFTNRPNSPSSSHPSPSYYNSRY